MAKIVETKDLVTNFYTYEGVVKALNKVSLTVDHGTTFGLVGESGCGKSVYVRSMMRIIQQPGKIDGGKILFYPDSQKDASTDLLKQSEQYMRHLRGNQMSMIFQEPNAALNPIMSIGDQIAESFLFHQKKDMSKKILSDLKAKNGTAFNPLKQFLSFTYSIASENPRHPLLKIFNKIPLLKWWQKPLKKEAIKRSVEILKKLHIPNPETVVTYYPHNLSGGMKQRIVIAIALACHPVLLIADEATSNLDVTIQAQILQLLRELKNTEISSILFITHDLGLVAEMCDKVGVMYAGNLCEVAEVNELFSNPYHPYTAALLNAVPKFSQEGALQSIEGSVPGLVSPPPGCRFHPRCKFMMDICKKELPDMVKINDNHSVACHYVAKHSKPAKL